MLHSAKIARVQYKAKCAVTSESSPLKRKKKRKKGGKSCDLKKGGKKEQPRSFVMMIMKCADIPSVSWFGEVAGLVILCFTPFSYLPQYHEIVSTQSSKGINTWSFLLGQIGSYAQFLSCLLFDLMRVLCCKEEDWAVCRGNMLVVLNLFMAWVVQIPLLFVVIRYQRGKNDTVAMGVLRYMSTLIMYIPAIATPGVIIAATFGPNSEELVAYARLVALAASIVTMVQWVPQIITNIFSNENGSLSLLMICILITGNVVTISFQSFVYEEDFMVWAPNLAELVQLLVLLGLCMRECICKYVRCVRSFIMRRFRKEEYEDLTFKEYCLNTSAALGEEIDGIDMNDPSRVVF